MRITRKHVDAKLQIINDMLGTNPRAWNVIGTIELYSTLGAYSIHRVTTTSGGVESLTTVGTLREASEFLSGMIAALRIVEGR
jgi:hypothetical protein